MVNKFDTKIELFAIRYWISYQRLWTSLIQILNYLQKDISSLIKGGGQVWRSPQVCQQWRCSRAHASHKVMTPFVLTFGIFMFFTLTLVVMKFLFFRVAYDSYHFPGYFQGCRSQAGEIFGRICCLAEGGEWGCGREKVRSLLPSLSSLPSL